MTTDKNLNVPQNISLEALQTILQEEKQLTLLQGRALLARTITTLHPLLHPLLQDDYSTLQDHAREYWEEMKTIQHMLEDHHMLDHKHAQRLLTIIHEMNSDSDMARVLLQEMMDELRQDKEARGED